jgi:hypothetical protein
MNETPSGAPLRAFSPTLLTGLFLPARTPPPVEAPLPDAPLPNPSLRLPAGGLTLFYGNNAPGLMGQALQRAQRQGYYGIGARVFAAFARVQQASRALPHARLPEVEVLWLNRIHCVRETAERLQAHALRHLREAGCADPPETPLRFAELGRHPELLERVLAEPEFAHLKAVVLTLPGAEAPDGNRPSAQIVYLRDPGAIRAIEVDYGAPLGQKAFRVPTPDELARPSASFNPFAATLPKPGVVVMRQWPVG